MMLALVYIAIVLTKEGLVAHCAGKLPFASVDQTVGAKIFSSGELLRALVALEFG